MNAFGALLDPDIRPALQDGMISLVRPDGYLACSASDTAAIESYFRALFPQAAGPADITLARRT